MLYVKLSVLAKFALIVAVALALVVIYFRWYSKAVLTAGAQPADISPPDFHQADIRPSKAPAVPESMESTLDEETSHRLLRVIIEARNDLDAPSLQAAVIIRSKGRWTGSVGWTDPRKKRAATIRDLYHVGSVSKLYTATVILKLAQDGKLSLADPVGKFISGIPNGEKITIRQLLNHTSGLYNFTESPPFLLKTVLLRHRWTVDETLQIVKGHKPYFEPGAGHYYSNSNFVLLGKIAEQVSGRPFFSLLKENILTPLGLKNSFFAPQEGHTGIFPGFSNVTMYSPEKGYVVTVLSNLATGKVNKLNKVIEKIQSEVLDRL